LLPEILIRPQKPSYHVRDDSSRFSGLIWLRAHLRVFVAFVVADAVASPRGHLNDVLAFIVDNVLFVIEHCGMTPDDLKAALTELGISQADFARLINVTPRAVALWISGDRGIPGPADGYLRLLQLLPMNLRQVELNRLKQKGTNMRDGMFGITFQGQHGSGMGVLIFDCGRVYGADEVGVRYDGEYVFDENSGLADVKAKVTFPPNVRAVQGISNPYEWSFDITAKFDPKQNRGKLALQTSLGKPVSAQYVFLRSLPESA